MNRRPLASLATFFCAATFCFSASATSYLYTFQYAPLSLTFHGQPIQFEAASISFTSDHIAVAGDSLTWLSGDINGCAPSSLDVDATPSGTSFSMFPHGTNPCNNTVNPGFDGLLFYAPVSVTGPGFYDAPGEAARMSYYDHVTTSHYGDGSLTVSEMEGGTVPEPATLALASLALVAAAGCTRRRR